MPIVVGISLRVAGKIYSFDPCGESYYLGERVLVETARGIELGTVRQPPHEVPDVQVVQPLKRVLRHASDDDLVTDAANRDREVRALDACQRSVMRLNLPMRLIDAQYTFDGSHVLINFQAESRVDFRELVRELARELRTRIELRQVGVRDEAKLLDGYGMCGRRLCCSAFLTNFTPVAINMAKAQGLALNPQKISGTCGRLMCCLAFEYEHYSELRVGMPKLNAHIETPRGPGKVTKVNALGRQVEVTFPGDDTPVWFTVDELNGAPAAAPPCAADACAGCEGHKHLPLPPAQFAPNGPAESANAPEGDGSVRQRRGRGRGPAQGGGQAPAQAVPQPNAEGGESPEKRARRRRRPRTADDGNNGDAPPPASAPQAEGAPDAAPAPRPFPSARYRPRRRR